MDDINKGNWKVLKGKLKQKYARLADNDRLYLEGKEEEVLGRLQQILGKTRAEVGAMNARLSLTEPVKG